MKVNRWIGSLALCLLLVGAGCTEPIYHGLGEKEANEMVVVLEQHGLEAGKERDPAADNAWKVTVPSAVKVEAWRVLQTEGLPRPEVSGFDAFYPSGGMVPTASEERVLLQYSTAQELRKSLLAVDTVVDAQVNLVLPEKPRVQLETTVVEPPRASVLIKYRSDSKKPPLGQEKVRSLVAGGVEGLDAKNVDVIFTRAARSAQPLVEPAFATVGPVSVAEKSKGVFQLLVVAMALCIVMLTGGVVFLIFRMRRKANEVAG
ncbi:secretion protein [Persicimonas caeni]|uniref:secretion protein n=1 Tax=Persicimonas caeni TaxID=2292766 RepID=UPI00143D400B|nr:secretion protein [Persicimonas caeni]